LNSEFELTGEVRRHEANSGDFTEVEVRHIVCGTTSWQRPIEGHLNKCSNNICRSKKIQATHSSKTEEEIQIALEKRIQTNLSRYGVENVSQVSEIKRKKIETMQANGTFNGTIGKRSKAEIELAEFIIANCPYEVILNSRSILPSCKELDIYIPEKKLAIEYCGIFWHSSSPNVFRPGIPKDYHLQKFQEAAELGIHLITLFSDEYEANPNLIKSKLLHYCGINNAPSIHARKCQIKEISKKEADELLIKNHTQGTTTASIRLGAFYEDKLVACMLFGKNFRSKSMNEAGGYELSRFCTDVSYRIPNIFSKLVSYFWKHYPEAGFLYSYADHRWVSPFSSVYLNSGWILDSTGKPDYTYYNSKDKTRRHKSAYQKKKIYQLYPDMFDETMGLTEFEMTDQIPELYRIYDCGKSRFILNRPKI